MFNDAVWLARKEFRHQWMGFLITIIVTIFMGMLTSGLLLSESESAIIKLRVDSNSIFADRFLLDLIFIGMAPSFATIFMAKPYLSYRVAKDDPHGKRMAVLRSLPIPVSVLALSRTLFMLMILGVLALTFYGTVVAFVFVFSNSYEFMTISEFVTFILFWFGYMLALGGMSPYIEFGKGGKILHILPFVFLGLFLVLQITFYTYFGFGIVEKSIELVKEMGWLMTVISLSIGVMCSFGWNKLLKKRLANRDYL
ncbi:hypothetical protein [Salinibacillus xinjiangensis]|uniref:Uncharacterized protein n=1 Tax=Salinibacillus xinjiangensis TaxID=1229268 RepID=A0A6G1X726_9BACI|nr:hypothetical protein [Salinibacillus xinjiangensis]MRG86747.1 hypothetical protein [Salinibacillus xinjiangensis]